MGNKNGGIMTKENAFESSITNLKAFTSARDAITHLEKALELHPTDHRTWSELASIYYCLRDNVNAIACLNQAIDLSAGTAPARYYKLKGMAYLDDQIYRLALSAFDKALEIDPKDADTLVKRGDAFYYLSQWMNAAYSYSAALEIDPNHPTAFETFCYWDYQQVLETTKRSYDEIFEAIKLWSKYANE